MLERTSRRVVSSLLSAGILMFLAPAPLAQEPAGHLVDPVALEKLLPTPEGWSRGVVRSSQVELSAECQYTFATVTYTKGDMRIKLTLADTGRHAENLMALASMIVTLPDGHVGEVPPATTIKRMKIGESPAAEMWDSANLTGEVTVLVGGRIVTAIEAQKADGVETLHAILAAVDLKALAALK